MQVWICNKRNDTEEVWARWDGNNYSIRTVKIQHKSQGKLLGLMGEAWKNPAMSIRGKDPAQSLERLWSKSLIIAFSHSVISRDLILHSICPFRKSFLLWTFLALIVFIVSTSLRPLLYWPTVTHRELYTTDIYSYFFFSKIKCQATHSYICVQFSRREKIPTGL